MRCMRGSPKPLKTHFQTLRKCSQRCSRVTAGNRRIEKAAQLWGKAGRRSLERSALIEAVSDSSVPSTRAATFTLDSCTAPRQIKLQSGATQSTPPYQRTCCFGSKLRRQWSAHGGSLNQLEALGDLPKIHCCGSSVLFGLVTDHFVAFDGNAYPRTCNAISSPCGQEVRTCPSHDRASHQWPYPCSRPEPSRKAKCISIGPSRCTFLPSTFHWPRVLAKMLGCRHWLFGH